MKNLYLLLIAAFLISSCTDEPKPEPDPVEEEKTEMTVMMSNEANSKDLQLISEDYTLPNGEVVFVTRLAYILGDFILVKDDGSEIALEDQYALIDPKFNKNSFMLEDIPKGNYKGIKFSLGLDSEINHGDPSKFDIDHPLSPVNNSLHWSWAGGYIFMAIEGKIKATNESFVFHLAGSQNKTDYSFEVPFVKNNGALSVDMSMNFDEIFKNPSVFSLKDDGMGTHSTSDPVTTKLFANMVDIFTVNSISE